MFSRSVIARRLVAAAVAAATVLALGVGGAARASADTPQPAFPNSSRINLGFYPLPNKPAKSLTPGTLPVYEGTMGDPTQIFLGNGTTGQALTAVSNAWDSAVKTAPATGGASQTWYFQRVGTVALSYSSLDDYGPGDMFWIANGMIVKEPVYKIVRYDNGGGHSCLDALGGSGSPGTSVGLYRCDPNAVNQANQLWMITDFGQSRAVTYASSGVTGGEVQRVPAPPFSDGVPDTSSGPYLYSSTIQSIASLQANGWQPYGAPILSAAVDTAAGSNSRLALFAPAWPVSELNSTFLRHNLKDASSDNPHNDCTGFGCMFKVF